MQTCTYRSTVISIHCYSLFVAYMYIGIQANNVNSTSKYALIIVHVPDTFYTIEAVALTSKGQTIIAYVRIP